ncbi:MAG: hypothetical protein ABSG03_31935 [Bryobacteraceae bacterium]|jgi:uncharacterized protein (TIGR03437 family)
MMHFRFTTWAGLPGKFHSRTAIRLVSLVLLATAGFGQTYNASTFAGVWLPENLPGASVSLNQIGGVAVDAAGNVFLSLPEYAAVMRLDASTGILTRVAGNATNGFSGDNGPAINAQLYGPNGLALDPAGNLYIADTNNKRIRKVSNGIITTVAGNGVDGAAGDGGPATSAELPYPYSIAIDAAGNIYISDDSGAIRKVTNGVIASVPGAQGYFAGIAVDSVGNLYLVDALTPRVLKVSNGVATIFAGTGTPGFSGDNGPATGAQFGGYPDDGAGDGSGPIGIAVDSAGNVYICDTFNSRVRKISNGVITTVAGGSTANQLTYPTFITVDSAGDLFISDPSSGDRIQKVANGAVTTIAGNGYYSFSGDNGPAANAQFYQPEGVAIDSAGRIYIADTQNNRVRMIANGVVTTVAGTGALGSSGDGGPASSARLATPVAVAVDPAGNLYIADVNNYRIRKVSDGVITTVAGTVGYTPCDVAADSAGNVYVSDCVHSHIFKVSNGNATTLAAGGSGLALDSAGNLYMTNCWTCSPDQNSGAILEISNGVVTTIGGGTGVAFDSAGNRYIVDGNLGLVRILSNGATTIFPMGPALAFPGVGIAVDSSGNIYGSDFSRILVLKPAGATPPTPVAVDFVHNAASDLFLGIAPGEIVTFKGSGLGPAQLVAAHAGTDGFYPTQLSGTLVQFNGVAAPMLYTSATQVAAVVPWGITGPTAQVTMTYQGQASVPATIQVFPSAPGLFTLDGSGTGQAAAINQDGTINGASNPALSGSVISLYATGGGQTLPGGVDGQVSEFPLAAQALPVQVSIGQQFLLSTAQLQYVGPAPGAIAGLMQINVPIPAGLKTGSAVISIVGAPLSSSQSNVTIAVR